MLFSMSGPISAEYFQDLITIMGNHIETVFKVKFGRKEYQFILKSIGNKALFITVVR